ncbi:MAG TPA: hypothetical protein PK916_06300 [Bacteroidota bacterium]|nr:hypothetical protein [Bacteroidota bacterium]
MKQLTFSLALFFSLVLTLMAQQIEIPVPVQEAQNLRYPKAEAVIWDATEEGEFVATFMLGALELSSRYDEKGMWLGTLIYLDQSDVPQPIHATVARKYSSYEMYDVMKVEEPAGGSYYEATLESDADALLVRFDAAGKVLLSERIDMELE